MSRLVEELLSVLPATFTSDEYLAQRKRLEEEYKSHQTQALEELRDLAKAHQIALIQTPGGFAFAPMKDGEVVSPDEFLRYTPEEQKRIEAEVVNLQENLQRIMRQAPFWQREVQQKLKHLNREVAEFAVEAIFRELQQKYEALPAVTSYLDEVRHDVIENFNNFLDEERPPAPSLMGIASTQSQAGMTRYSVNVIVSHNDGEGAPVIFEEQPRYQNLIGRVEHVSQMGTLLTDFTLIKPGALHRANGGYLVLDARRLLTMPYAWDALKDALRNAVVLVESLGQAYSMISTVALEPEPIPLDVKVILVGDRLLYYLLCEYDQDFAELFKVAADFEDDMERSPESCQAYAQLISALARKEGLRHLTRAAVARVIEYSSRFAGDAEKLSVHMQTMSDLLREADFWAGQAGRELVDREDVQGALDAQTFRSSRLRDRIQENILRESILIDTDGEAVGQINGLAVYQVGQFAFGKPNKITARVRLGKGEVVDIEREAELGGPIHSKGVLILAGYLGARYASERPLSLSASLVFEQSYGGVEGDSASSAELYALISAIADIPLKQSLAVTGSVNQHGVVQAIGGVNEKIEGFFELCIARGLTGQQGVLIPAANVKNLMLHEDVIEAVRGGTFHIYPVSHIDEGITLLTGMVAGEPDETGEYPAESVNGCAVARLADLAEKVRAFSAPPKEDEAHAQGANGEQRE